MSGWLKGPIMKHCLSLLAAAPLAACGLGSGDPTDAATGQTIRFENGLWYQDGAFHARTVDVRDARLDFDADGQAAQVVDLEGGYVVPPLCEGHNHNLGGSAELNSVQATIDTYTQYGVFYAMMQGSFAVYREAIAEMVNQPQSVDVVFSNNGLTGSGGHPRSLRERLMEQYGSYPEFTPESLADAGYFEADTLEEVREKWALIRAEQPNFVKVMLYFSEEYALRRDDPAFFGRRGLNPDLLPEVVRLAHADGLRVSVHVESEADMVTAITAGADMIAHLPSYDAPIALSDEAVALAADSNVALITTFSLAKRVEFTAPETYERIIAAQADNLRRLADAGARLVVGSDNVRGISHGEAMHINALGVLEPSEILHMWTEACAETAFPERAIGRLENGFEASFIVTADNPLEDLTALQRLSLRVKDGEVLPQPEPAPDEAGD